MTMRAYSIRDAKAKVFGPPFYKSTHGEAERALVMLLKDEKSMINQFPEDYDLYHVGEYDDQTGVFAPLDTPTHIVKAVQLAPSHA